MRRRLIDVGLDWHDFLTALALMLVFEGLLPFANPGGWRRALSMAARASDASLRAIGLGVMITGIMLLGVVR